MGGSYNALISFTLAEVLIVLGIIGLIADMTIPTLMNNIQNAQFEAGFKTSYSMLSQAIMLMGTQEGPIYKSYSSTNTQNILPVFAESFSKYFKGSTRVFNLAETIPIISNYKTYNNLAISTQFFDDGSLSLLNGMTIYTEAYFGFPMISIDINGYKKKPNRWGYDLFSFVVTKNDTLLPLGSEESMKYLDTAYSNLDVSNYSLSCDYLSTNSNNGIGCSNRAIAEKDYFKNLK